MPLQPGTTLGPYKVTAKIGEGGMGEVYRARDTKLDRDVALKVLPEAFTQDPDRLARFEREAKVLASLNHPNIAAIYGLEEADGIRALVLELVEGPTLADRIKRGPIPLDEALPIAKQIAEALEAAHEAGIIHRDLKPANIKVKVDGTVKVLDFGLAKALDPNPEGDPSQSPTLTAAATQMGVIMGTAAYMSPEQARGKPVDKRADIWAFGCVLYEMLTGQMAFHGEDVSLTLASVMKSDVDVAVLPADLPETVRTVIRQCLQKDPKRRIRDIGDVQLAMEGIFETAGDQQPKTVASPLRRRTVVGLMSVTALVSLMVGSVWDASPRSELRDQMVRRASILLPVSASWPVTGHKITISADGATVVFSLTVDGDRQLYLRETSGMEVAPIPGTERASSPILSPDGQDIAFFRNGQLLQVSVNGGRATVICDCEAFQSTGTWADDDTLVIGSREGLLRVSAEGGTADLLTETDAEAFEQGHAHPSFLDRSQALLFEVRKANADNEIHVLDIDNGSRAFVLVGEYPTYVNSGHLVYWSAGALWAVPFDATTLRVQGRPVPVLETIRQDLEGVHYALSADGTLAYVPKEFESAARFVWVDRNGRVTDRSDVFTDAFSPSISPSGSHIAYSTGRALTDTYTVNVLDLTRGVTTRITERGGAALWSPNGEEFVFSLFESGSPWELFLGSLTNTQVTQLTSGGTVTRIASSWSSDGQFLAYVDGSVRDNDIWILSLAENEEPHVFLDTEFDETQPAIAPSGRFIAYRSNRSGQDEVYVESFLDQGRERQLVSTDGGAEPRWSVDGTELYYRSGTHMMVVPVLSESRLTLGTAEPLFIDEFRTIPEYRSAGYDVTPRGEFLMVDDEAGRLWAEVVFNYPVELDELVPVD